MLRLYLNLSAEMKVWDQ